MKQFWPRYFKFLIVEIWLSVRQWLYIFKKYDEDVSGKFDAFELRQGISAFKLLVLLNLN